MTAHELLAHLRANARRCTAEWRDGALVVRVEIIDRLVPPERPALVECGDTLSLGERRRLRIRRVGRSRAERVPSNLG